jgi:NitT/TauT family transport system substrate-binding protein
MRSEPKLAISGFIIIMVIVSSNSDLNVPFLSGKDGGIGVMEFENANTKSDILNIAYFPNLNHAPAIIQQENKTFGIKFDESNLRNITISRNIFNSGISLLEALYSGKIDIAYVNPSTIIDSFILLGNQDFRIISGLSSDGVSFVVRNDSGIGTVNDLGGKTFASPQLGNTQDVALRKYLVDNGFNTIENGGNVTVVASKPGDIIEQFQNKEIDGAWVPEPIPTILKQQANGSIFVDEKDLWPDGKFVTGNIIVRTDYLRDNPDAVKKFLEAHVDWTLWINEQLLKMNSNDMAKINDSEIVSDFNEGLKNITGKTYLDNQLSEALSKIEFTTDPLSNSLVKIVEDAQYLGLIKMGSNWKESFNRIYDLTLLNEVLKEKGIR